MLRDGPLGVPVVGVEVTDNVGHVSNDPLHGTGEKGGVFIVHTHMGARALSISPTTAGA